jgi:hypothetical protein
MTKSEKWALIHDQAVGNFDKVQIASRDERLQCLQDRRFYSIAGAQWEGPLGVQFENKPRFEVNKIHLAVIRVVNEYRNNRITVNFVAKDGTENEGLTDACASLYRADEQDSSAEEAYDNAFEEAVGGGFGAWRVRACYEDEEDDEDERQRIRIEPIFDADSSVFFDLNAKRQDKADARECWVLTAMTRDAYKEEWGDDPASWPKQIHQRMFDWLTPDVVYVAEYYRVEEKAETIHIFEGLAGDERRIRGEELEEDEGLAETLAATGFREVRQKKVKRRRVRKYIMSGSRILEDCGHIAGNQIPIVPVYGKRWFVDNVERCMGHVRLAKDPQRLKNMQLSKLGEIAAVGSVEKPIFTPEQVAGHQLMWAEDNQKNYPYLLVNSLVGPDGSPIAVGPQASTKAPEIPAALAGLLQITEQDMQDVLGNQQAGEQLQANLSGKAVELVQNRLDMQTFIYMSNMSKAVKRCGEIWLSMAKEIYIEEGRKLKGIGQQGETRQVELLRPVMDEKGIVGRENDLTDAALDVAVDVGPSSASKRQTTVKSLMGMMQITQDPETLQVLSAMAMMNMEGEGISEVRDFYRKKLVRMGAIKPTQQEIEEMQQEAANKAPDPQAEYVKALALESEAKAQKAIADTQLTMAKAEQVSVDTMLTAQGAGQPIPDTQGAANQQPAEDPATLKMELEIRKQELAEAREQRRLEMEEERHALQMADSGAMITKDEGGRTVARHKSEANAERIASQLTEVVGELKTVIQTEAERSEKIAQAQVEAARIAAEAQNRAVEAIKKPKRIIREGGKIVGFETK